MLLILQTAQDIHVRLNKAIHGHVCLRYLYHLSAELIKRNWHQNLFISRLA